MATLHTKQAAKEPLTNETWKLIDSDHLPLGWLLVDTGGNVLQANVFARQLLGVDSEVELYFLPSLREVIAQNTGQLPNSPSTVSASVPIDDGRWCEATIFSDTATSLRRFGIILRPIDDFRRYCLESHARLQQLVLINEMTAALNSTLGLDETFNVILVGVTAQEGLRFNRAFLFLDDHEDEWLHGRIAIGPTHPDEAGYLWEAIARLGTRGLVNAINTYRMELDGHDAAINTLVGKARIPRGGHDNPFAEIINQRCARIITADGSYCASAQEVFQVLDSTEFACAPLCTRDRAVGMLLADNRITGRRIDADSLHGLELLAVHAGAAVERARLADALGRQIKELQWAHRKIAGIQETMAELERLSVVGEVTNEVAHQLRNPLTIIGGFARSLLAGRDEQDKDHRALKIISEQTDRINALLERLISPDRGEKQQTYRFQFEPVIRQALEVVSCRFVARDISYTLSCDNHDYLMMGQPDGVRFALCELISSFVRHIPGRPQLVVRIAAAVGVVRVIISLMEADTLGEALIRAHAKMLAGDWGVRDERRNLALGYLAEQGGGFGLESTDQGQSLVIELHDKLEANP